MNVCHAALGVPRDIDCIRTRRAVLAGAHGGDPFPGQRIHNALRAEHQHPAKAALTEHMAGDAVGREEMRIRDGQAERAQARPLLRGRVSAAIGQRQKGRVAILQMGEQFHRAGQELIAAQRLVAEDQRAIEIEHEATRGAQALGEGGSHGGQGLLVVRPSSSEEGKGVVAMRGIAREAIDRWRPAPPQPLL